MPSTAAHPVPKGKAAIHEHIEQVKDKKVNEKKKEQGERKG